MTQLGERQGSNQPRVLHLQTSQISLNLYLTYLLLDCSKDLLNRWVYPLVPDSFQPEANPTSYKRNHLYLHRDVILSRSCILDTAVLIGSGCRVGVEGGGETRITRSTIGKNCIIGAGVCLEDVYLWDAVQVGDNVKISKVLREKRYITYTNLFAARPHHFLASPPPLLSPFSSLRLSSDSGLGFWITWSWSLAASSPTT